MGERSEHVPLPDLSLHQRVAQHAAAAPQAVAVECAGERLTYAELDARANQVAHLLGEHGVGRGDPVAVCAGRDTEVVVALLGVLKAGGYYVPLDPEYPAERLAFMAADSGARILLVQPESAHRFDAVPGLHAVPMAKGPVAPGRPTTPPPVATHPDDLAYLMYTSGSTGRPKGVGITHRNVMRLVHGVDYVDLDPGQVVLMLASLSFDASTFEIWGPLANGARLAVLPQGIPTGETIERAVRDHGVTLLMLTSGLFQHVVRTRPDALAPVRHVLVVGDVAPPAEVRALIELGVEVSNGYGPTECTTFSCVRRGVTPAETAGSIPIGAAITNTTAYVVDDRGRRTPPGTEGELLIGGPGVGLGYLGRPALTAERFVPDPFGTTRGGRLYRTGDLVVRQDDGLFRFLGRRDQQVKILGHRVEPGEIEAALSNHPELAAAAVAVRPTAAGGKQLVGYVVPAGDAAPTGAQLRAYLGERLPDHLVPTAWVTLAALPLTPNGKVDRAALPDPAAGGRGPVTAARTPLEESVAEIWTELLGVDPIDVHDDFFTLGGQSLLATQVVARLQERFPVALPVRAVFDAPTVERLAALVHRAITEHVEQLTDSEVELMLSQVREG
ncbi:amino acid adenylation domain-containing protein [Kitasatospora sp. NPDC085464]|uniref:amino acid adenylation domain-containing protein n=1 Tax=Kitasatospora sp. NPDC085464 TaxID=3364063 RepID=UPI0037CA1F11